MTIETARGTGTTVKATFQASHIDRMPLGDLPGTILALVVGYPSIDFVYRHVVQTKALEFDTRPVKAVLDGLPLSEPAVIAYLKQALCENGA
jgi:hypothetical protein